MTTSRHGPNALGLTRATMAGTEGSHAARRSESQKAGLSWDCRLQPACMNPEPLVTAGQQTAVNMSLGPAHLARRAPGAGPT